MKILVIGSTDSGKSAYAEARAADIVSAHRFYIATMLIQDDDGYKRVVKHRKMREGAGFNTLEVPRDVQSALLSIPDPKRSLVLLECISNLVGNELYNAEPGISGEEMLAPARVSKLKSKIVSDVCALADAVQDIIIVANRYEEDAPGYDDATRRYVFLNNAVSNMLKDKVDEVVDISAAKETAIENEDT